MKDRFSTSRRPGFSGLWLGALAALVIFLLAGTAAAQGRTGQLIVLGLRAPDGDDVAAQNMTTALRAAARAGGFSVPNDSPALEQVMAMYSCDESLPPACLRQIAADQNHQRVLYGTVRRHGSGRNAPLLIEVSYFDPTTDRENEGPPVEIAPAAAGDNVQLNAGATRILDGLFPAQAAVVVTNQHGAGAGHEHNGNGNGNGAMVDTSPTPIRRYIGYGAAGVGLVLGIIGVVEGVMWFNLQGQQTASTNGVESPWIQYNRGGTFEDTCSRAAMEGRMDITSVCDQSRSLSTGAWAFAGAGVALIAIGAVLYVTDSSSSPPAASNDDPNAARRARRSPSRMRINGAPVISPTYGGAVLQVSF